ncbi:uncharacterized protein LOC110054378 [Orbicella faveolata]|uniref:uncharacterized protein LOC110054378 n=1 Tax=Orbicella faveolata TaxID=48498 RepID=UPI0009E450DA|nr:uncharacterized protein LOC110054378 [Orbicella faveolata]
MSSKVVCRKRSKRKSRQLQALRDFTAADTCYSDGANPLSFHIGEIFTFLSRRDNYWVNVERTVRKHNPLLKTKDYSAIERGIVPLDYVIEMETKQNEGMSSLPNEDDYPAQDGDESQDNIFKFSCHLIFRYYAVGETVVSTKEELAITQQSLIEEQERSHQYQKQLEDIKSQINKSGNKSAIKLLDKIIQKEIKSQPNGLIQKTRSESSSGDLMLSCALCHEKMRVDELATHSKVCSSKDKGKPPTTPTTPGTELLRVTVTCSETDEKNATFKVVTKTTQENFKFSDYEVHRSEGDFEWLQSALEEACPERIIPPMVSHSSLHGKMREVQRFLSRICAHKVLKKHHLLNLFLTGEGQLKSERDRLAEELEQLKRKLDEAYKENATLHERSAQEYKHNLQLVHQLLQQRLKKTLSSPTMRFTVVKLINFVFILLQRYLEQFAANLDGLITHLQDCLNKNTIDGPGVWFKSMADFEPAETYLKVATAALSKICIELENNRETAEEKLIVNDLKSVYHYVKSAGGLLQRVQAAVETFLFWDEEVRAYEQREKPSSEDSADNSSDQTQKWAVANSNCADAKTSLEFLCKDLSSELAHFDWRKEVELREILTEYSALRSEHFEKVQSKWFGVKLMVEAPIAAEVRAIKCMEES